MTVALRFANVSKVFRRGHAPSFREDTLRVLQHAFGGAQERNAVHALSDVSFEVEQGTSFAIMGANGSGKTTALTLASRVAYPTSGTVQMRGRVGALLDVGTGLHHELSGRENVWLYGRILGLRRDDIARQFDDIVDFADIGEALDQPLKQYSSGMRLRLGFAIASQLEPDVLLVDEAISVGDAGFQSRCLDRMAALHESGATIVFVSHVTSIVPQVCTQGLLLSKGRVRALGPIDDIVAKYLDEVAAPGQTVESEKQPLRLRSWDYDFTPGRGRYLGDLVLRLRLTARRPSTEPRIVVAITHPRAGALVRCSMMRDGYPMGTVSGDFEVICRIHDLPLESGEYGFWVSALDPSTKEPILGPIAMGRALMVGHATSQQAIGWAASRASDPILRMPYEWELVSDELELNHPEVAAGG